MPVITLEIGSLSKDQKKEIVKAFVSSASKITNIPEEAFVTLIKENSYDNIGNGTLLLSEKYQPKDN